MKHLLALSLVVAAAATATADTITFDDITTDDWTIISNGYSGLNWSNMYILSPTAFSYQSTGYGFGLKSGAYVAYNAFAEPAMVSSTSGADITGISGYWTSAWTPDNVLTVQGLVGGSVVQTATLNLLMDAPTYMGMTFGQKVDSVRFSTSNAHFALDNMTVTQAVPEPASMAALGIGALGLLKRRKKA